MYLGRAFPGKKGKGLYMGYVLDVVYTKETESTDFLVAGWQFPTTRNLTVIFTSKVSSIRL